MRVLAGLDPVAGGVADPAHDRQRVVLVFDPLSEKWPGGEQGFVADRDRVDVGGEQTSFGEPVDDDVEVEVRFATREIGSAEGASRGESPGVEFHEVAEQRM